MRTCECGHAIKFYHLDRWYHNKKTKINSKWKDNLNEKCHDENCNCINPRPKTKVTEGSSK